MNTEIPYSKKLLDPRWIELRDKILQRDMYKCAQCFSVTQLQVHHTHYTGEPWEAPDSDLITLCSICHAAVHQKSIPTYLGKFGMHHNYALRLAARNAYEATPTLQILMAYVERENLVRMRPAAIAQQLGISTATVDRHMSKLRKLGIIEPDPVEADKKQAVVCWRICPFLAWRGKNEDLVQYLSKLPSDHVWYDYKEPTDK